MLRSFTIRTLIINYLIAFPAMSSIVDYERDKLGYINTAQSIRKVIMRLEKENTKKQHDLAIEELEKQYTKYFSMASLDKESSSFNSEDVYSTAERVDYFFKIKDVASEFRIKDKANKGILFKSDLAREIVNYSSKSNKIKELAYYFNCSENSYNKEQPVKALMGSDYFKASLENELLQIGTDIQAYYIQNKIQFCELFKTPAPEEPLACKKEQHEQRLEILKKLDYSYKAALATSLTYLDKKDRESIDEFVQASTRMVTLGKLKRNLFDISMFLSVRCSVKRLSSKE